jgi:hypothetical protein
LFTILAWYDVQYIYELTRVHNLTCSLSIFVAVAELPTQPFLVLYCHFSISSSNVTYYGCATEIVPICIPKVPVMFYSMIFSIKHSRVEGKTASFHRFCYLTSLILEVEQNKAIWPWSYTHADVLKQADIIAVHLMYLVWISSGMRFTIFLSPIRHMLEKCL